MPRKLLYLALVSLPAVFGQQTSGQGSNSSPPGWGTKTIQVKYIDPEQLRDVYSGRSFVIQVNRELKLLTVSGPTQFLDEVEETAKRLDVAPALPKDIEVTVYLLATVAQAPSVQPLPAELQNAEKRLNLPALRLADSETMRIREGQPGDLSFGPAAGVSLTHIALKSASVTSGAKADVISLTGLHCWLSKGSGQQPPSNNDFTTDIDVTQNEAALVAKSGVDKPIAVVVTAHVLR